jgi:hypothetical protein
VVVGIHFVVVLFVVSLPFLVLVGSRRDWAWVRNPWLRYSHLAILAYVLINALRGEWCFLTTWESRLRESAGQSVEQASFIGRLLHRIVFIDVDLVYINAATMIFSCFVLVSLIAVKPGRGARSKEFSPGADQSTSKQARR